MSTRIAITILLLLLLPVVIGPIVIGVMIERGVERLQAQIPPSQLEIEFDRGLYTSTARTRIPLAGEAGEGAVLVVDHVLVHGPIPLAAPAISRSPFDLAIVLVRSRVEPDTTAMPGIEEALGGDALLTLQSRVTSVGDVDVDVEAPGFELDTGRLIWAGLSGRVTVRESGRDVAGDLGSPGLRLADDEASLVVHDTRVVFSADLEARRLEARLEQAGTEWVVGDRRFETGRFTVEADQPVGGDLFGESHSSWSLARMTGQAAMGGSDFDVSGIDVEQTVTLDAESGLHRVAIGLAFDEWRVGPAPADGPGGMTLVLDRIDRAAVEQFRDAMQKLEASGGSPEEVAAMRPFVAMEQLPGVLASSPSFDVRDAFVEGPEGRLEGSLRFAVDGSHPELLADPFMLMNEIEAHATLAGPEPLVRRILERVIPAPEAGEGQGALAASPELALDPESQQPGEATTDVARLEPSDRIDAWIAEGTLVRQGDRLAFEARFQDGLPTLNGEPADPAFLMQLMPGM